MRKIRVRKSLVFQLENIKGYGFEDSTDEIYNLINTIHDDYTAGYVQAVVEGYTDSLAGDELLEETISFIKLLISVHGEGEN